MDEKEGDKRKQQLFDPVAKGLSREFCLTDFSALKG